MFRAPSMTSCISTKASDPAAACWARGRTFVAEQRGTLERANRINRWRYSIVSYVKRLIKEKQCQTQLKQKRYWCLGIRAKTCKIKSLKDKVHRFMCDVHIYSHIDGHILALELSTYGFSPASSCCRVSAWPYHPRIELRGLQAQARTESSQTPQHAGDETEFSAAAM